MPYDVEEEYEKSLQGVADCEDPGEDHGCSVHYKQAKHPGEAQQREEDDRGLHDGTVGGGTLPISRV